MRACGGNLFGAQKGFPRAPFQKSDKGKTCRLYNGLPITNRMI